MRRWRPAPALHFLALGGALFVAGRLLPPAASVTRVALRPDELASMRDAETLDDEVLRREALALGVDRRDRAVRERLARLDGFVGGGAREGPPLGLERHDVVITRHLGSMMRLAAGRLGPADLPSEEELRGWLAAHGGALAQPARVRFAHVYLGRDRRGAALEDDAARLLAALRATGTAPQSVRAGDAFLHGSEVGPASLAEVARLFGRALADEVARAPVGAWTGPLRSPYGLHLVWLRERLPARPPALDAVRARVVHRVLRERSRARARERIAALRAQYLPR
jgi:hypothetical protein